MTLHRFCHRAKLSLAVAICFALCTSVYGQQTESENTADENKPAVEKKEKKTRKPTRVIRSLAPVDGYEPVDMFEAIEAGQISVRLIPKDATVCTIKVENKSNKPLAIQMPEAFAGVPVLAQGQALNIGGGGGPGGGGGAGGFGGGGLGGGGGGQGFGGGFGGGAGGGGFGGGGGLGGGRGGFGGGGRGGGLFNIPPGKTGRVKVTTFCLDHEKRDPKPRDEYTIKPIEDYCKDPAIAEICKLVASDQIAQPIAQAVAWNVANGVSWEELAAKERKRLMNGYVEMFFTPQQVVYASEVAYATRQYVEQRAAAEEANESDVIEYESPGERLGRDR